MKSQRFCNAVANPSTSPLLSFLAPSIQNSSRLSRRALQRPQYRSISSTTCLNAIVPRARPAPPSKPSATPALRAAPVQPAPVRELISSKPSSQVTQEQEAQEEAKNAPNKPVETRSDSSAKGLPPSGAQSQPFGTPMKLAPQAGRRSQQAMEGLLQSISRAPQNIRSSNSLLNDTGRGMTRTGLKQEELANRTMNRQGMQMMDLVSPTSPHQRRDVPLAPRIDAYMGRGVAVDSKRVPLGRALIILNSRLRSNDIRAQVKKQKFHERQGLKKKRLKSERWRKRFMVGFKHMLDKVKKMRKQGW